VKAMNREKRREAEKDIMRMPKQEILQLFYDMMYMVQNNELSMEEFEIHKGIIKKAWKKKFGTDIMLDDVITSEE